MYQQKCPIYQNSKAVRDMVLFLMYMRLKLADMPDNVIEHYKLCDVATPDGHVYCEIRMGMYGLKWLKEHGYTQSKTTPGLWKHEWRPITFSLVADDFGVKYVGDEHA